MNDRIYEINNLLKNANGNRRSNLNSELDFINLIIKEGYILIGKYINSTTPIEIMCTKGHITNTTSPSKFKLGRRCSVCAGKNQKNLEEQFRHIAIKEGYQVLGNYINSGTFIEMICPKGHIINSIKPTNFKRGSRCSICSGKSRGHAKNEFINLINQEGYQILGDYINTSTPVTIKCPNGHITNTTSPSSFRRGARCCICSGKSKEHAKSEFYKIAKKEGYKILGEYINTSTPIKMICPNGHITEGQRPSDFKKGSRCSICSGKNSEHAKLEFYKIAEKEGYKILGEYTYSNVPIKMECPKGHIMENTRPSDFKIGNRCIICAGKSLENSKKEFLELLLKEGYQVIDEYINSLTPIYLQCNKKHIIKIRPSDFKNGIRCSACSGHNTEYAKMNFYNIAINEGYKILGNYVNSHSAVEMICPNGHILTNTTPSAFKSGTRCSICSGNNSEYAKKEFYEIAAKENYKVLSDYVTSTTGIEMMCPEGHITKTLTPISFKRGNRCLICSGHSLDASKDEFLNLADKEGYKVLSEYINSKTPIMIRCPEGHITNGTTPGNFKRGVRCIECRTKYGENTCKEILETYNISYEREKKFEDLVGVNGGQLRFDFYIKELNTIIEIQGEGHFDGDTMLHRGNTIEHDKIKRNWCKEKGIKLIEIPYITSGKGRNKEQGIEDIKIKLNKFLLDEGILKE